MSPGYQRAEMERNQTCITTDREGLARFSANQGGEMSFESLSAWTMIDRGSAAQLEEACYGSAAQYHWKVVVEFRSLLLDAALQGGKDGEALFYKEGRAGSATLQEGEDEKEMTR
ncbi:hypothetical protein SESBI_00817 [Sesbania bispinosa]|nr:hypothetical protein SESBI_00817 [Sesbania bispinosa]